MVTTSMDMSWLRKQLEEADVDLLREMVSAFVTALMGAEADAVCNAAYGEKNPDRVNSRNGYRPRTWDTRAGTIELAIPKLRQGSYFPEWLLEPRRRAERAERALIAVVADCYLAFAEHLDIPVQRINELVRGKRGVTPETAWLLAGALGTTPEFWINLQTNHDLVRNRPRKESAN